MFCTVLLSMGASTVRTFHLYHCCGCQKKLETFKNIFKGSKCGLDDHSKTHLHGEVVLCMVKWFFRLTENVLENGSM